MRARTFARIGTALAGAAISTLAFAGAAQAASGTIMVPHDFNPAYSDTRATGHYEVQGTGLRIWTDGLRRHAEQGRGVRGHLHPAG